MSDYEEGYDEEEEVEEDGDLNGKKNVGIILIDVGPGMFDSSRYFKICLLAAFELMERMLLHSFRRNMSVCLLRDENIVLTGLNDNLIDSAKKIRKMLEKDIDYLKQQYERKSTASLSYVLTECMKQFSDVDKINPYIVVITDDDNPHEGDQNEKLRIIDVALSLKEIDVKLVILPLKANFKYNILYKELLKSTNDATLDIFEDDKVYNTLEDLNTILELIIQNRVNIRRYNFNMSEHQGENLEVKVQIRYFINQDHLYANRTVHRATNSRLKREYRNSENIDSDHFLLAKCANDPVKFSKKQYMFLSMPYGLQLLYVSEVKRATIHYQHKRGFLVQKDELVEYDKQQSLFDYMWQYCMGKNRTMVCGYHTSGNKQQPHIVELTPNTFHSKPCFIATFLASQDEVKHIPPIKNEAFASKDEAGAVLESKVDKDDPELKLVCDMINKMKLKKFNPYQWNDIKYDTKASHIKAQLLDIEPVDVDCSFPTEEEVTEKLGDLNTQLQGSFGYKINPPPAKKAKKK